MRQMWLVLVQLKLFKIFYQNPENYLSPDIEEIFLANNNKKLSSYKSPIGNKITLFKRFLPKSISRTIECFLFDKYYPSDSKILVLGDLPIRTHTEQILFLQNSLILKSYLDHLKKFQINLLVQKIIIQINLKFVNKLVVQSNNMKTLVNKAHPSFNGPIIIITPAVSHWIINENKRSNRIHKNKMLNLFYPASNYPHKNHKFISKFDKRFSKLINELVLTIKSSELSESVGCWIKYKDRLTNKI